jgi:hypothetical protein
VYSCTRHLYVCDTREIDTDLSWPSIKQVHCITFCTAVCYFSSFFSAPPGGAWSARSEMPMMSVSLSRGVDWLPEGERRVSRMLRIAPLGQAGEEHDRRGATLIEQQMRSLATEEGMAGSVCSRHRGCVRSCVVKRPARAIGGERMAATARVLVGELVEEGVKVATRILPNERAAHRAAGGVTTGATVWRQIR